MSSVDISSAPCLISTGYAQRSYSSLYSTVTIKRSPGSTERYVAEIDIPVYLRRVPVRTRDNLLFVDLIHNDLNSLADARGEQRGVIVCWLAASAGRSARPSPHPATVAGQRVGRGTVDIPRI